MTYLRTFRLKFPNGLVNEYRLNHKQLEFHLNTGQWLPLSESEIELHFTLETEVARWLKVQMAELNPFAA
jgi:hypothetical protein